MDKQKINKEIATFNENRKESMLAFVLGEFCLGEFSPSPDPLRHGIGHTVIQRRVPVSLSVP